MWAYWLLDQNIIEDRPMARDAGRLIERTAGEGDPSLQEFQAALSQTVGNAPNTIRRATNWFVARTS